MTLLPTGGVIYSLVGIVYIRGLQPASRRPPNAAALTESKAGRTFFEAFFFQTS